MAFIITHLSIALLAFLFPNHLSFFPLLLASIFPDLEYIPIGLYVLFKTRNFKKSIVEGRKIMYLHSILLTLFISIPTCFLVSYYILGIQNIQVLVLSISLGFLSHLFIDIPAHPDNMLYWPFKRLENTFRFKRLKSPKIYAKVFPKIFETSPEDVYFFNWGLVSALIAFILLMAFLA